MNFIKKLTNCLINKLYLKIKMMSINNINFSQLILLIKFLQ